MTVQDLSVACWTGACGHGCFRSTMDERAPRARLQKTLAELECARRVAAGASWLDANIPGWSLMIDLERLDMSDGDCCILGQIGEAVMRETGAWSEPIDRLSVEFGSLYPADLGFFAYVADGEPVHDDEYDELDVFWRMAVLARRRGGV